MNDDAGSSVEQALSSGDLHELIKMWEDFNRGETWREISAIGRSQARAAAAQFLVEVSEVAALEALRVNAKAVERAAHGQALVRHHLEVRGLFIAVGNDPWSTWSTGSLT